MPGKSQSGLLRAQVCCSCRLFTMLFWTPPCSRLDRYKDTHTAAKQCLGNYPATKASQEGEKSSAPTYRGVARQGAQLPSP